MNIGLTYIGFGILLINCVTFLSAAIDKSNGSQFMGFIGMLISLGIIITGCIAGE